MKEKILGWASWFLPRVRLTGTVWNMWEHQGWGDRISWSFYDKRRVDAHTTPRPVVGDEIRDKMASGKIARFVIRDIEYVSDPNDMWFAKLEDIGYVGEKPVNRRIIEHKDTEEHKKTIRIRF